MNTINLRAPDYLTDAQRAAWKDILQHAPEGLVKESDQLSLEVLACLLAAFRDAPDEMPAAKVVRLETMLSKFGLTPRDRLRIKPDPKDPLDDGWDDF